MFTSNKKLLSTGKDDTTHPSICIWKIYTFNCVTLIRMRLKNYMFFFSHSVILQALVKLKFTHAHTHLGTQPHINLCGVISFFLKFESNHFYFTHCYVSIIYFPFQQWDH